MCVLRLLTLGLLLARQAVTAEPFLLFELGSSGCPQPYNSLALASLVWSLSVSTTLMAFRNGSVLSYVMQRI